MSTAFVPVASTELDALCDFLRVHAMIMMFPLSNLTRYGLGTDHPRAMQAWVAKPVGQITDAVTISREGIVFPCCPTGDWAAAAAVVNARSIKGFVGAKMQVAALRKAMRLTEAAQLDTSEPSFVLDIAQLKAPDTQGFRLERLGAAPRELIVKWRVDYEVETLNAARADAEARAEQAIHNLIAADSHRVLFNDDEPVAMTGFNAALSDIVQIGGVYTPPHLRGRGYARAALAMHLTDVAAKGVKKAVLSAANETAARVYDALGFVRTGDFAIVIYENPKVVHV